MVHNARTESFAAFFKGVPKGHAPSQWQEMVAVDGLRAPAGLGKPEVALAWGGAPTESAFLSDSEMFPWLQQRPLGA